MMAGQAKRFKWTNMDEFERGVEKALDEYRSIGADKVQAAALVAESQAKAYCPVDTGRLRGSISTDLSEEKNLIIGAVSAHTNYAEYVEFGTSRMAPQPYLRPAMLAAARVWGR